MGQNNPAPPTALSTASMLAALGVTIMYGLAALVALLTSGTYNQDGRITTVALVSLTGLILWLVGMYNLSSVFKGANDNVSRGFKGVFNGQLGIVIATVVCILLFLLVLNTGKKSFSDIDRSVLYIKLVLVALCVCHVIFLSICNSHSRALKSAGLKSMGIVSAAFVIQLIVMTILALFLFVVLFKTEDSALFAFDHGLGGVYTLGILLGLTLVVAAVLLIVGMWNVRSELPKAYDGAFKRVGEL